MSIIPATPASIEQAAALIRAGGLAAFPTETVYGLGADALNPRAAALIFEVKKRPFFDPLIVHVDSIDMARSLSSDFPATARMLAEKFWPGPLTLVVQKNNRVPDIITSGLNTVALRMPAHTVALDLIRAARTPIAAPSANLFGCLSPTEAKHVYEQLGSAVPVILDGGACSIGVESTIISCASEEMILLRPGGLPLEDIEACAGPVVQKKTDIDRVTAPGQLPWHYAPVTPVEIVDTIDRVLEDNAYLFYVAGTLSTAENTLALTRDGDLRAAAASIFSALHRLDRLRKKVIYAEAVPEVGLGRAIMDRLRKAAQKSTLAK